MRTYIRQQKWLWYVLFNCIYQKSPKPIPPYPTKDDK